MQVEPNQQVKAGTPCSPSTGSVSTPAWPPPVALATAQAEYRQQAQQAPFDAKQQELPGHGAGTIGEKEAEVTYLREQE